MTSLSKLMYGVLISLCIIFDTYSANETLVLPLSSDTLNHSVNSENDNTLRKTAYLAERKEWLVEDARINFSRDIVLTSAEQKLDEHVKNIVQELQQRFLASNQFCPSKNFLSIKDCVETSPLFAILKRMPKGGVLHLHTSACGDAKWLVKRAIADENCYIYMQDDGSVLQGKMMAFAKDKVPAGFQLMSELAARDYSFVAKVVNMISLTPEDSASVNPWNKFNACFERVADILYYAPVFIDYYRHSFESLAADNIQIVELRAGSRGFSALYDIEGKTYSSSDVIGIYRSLIQQIRKKYPEFTLKLIISDVRIIDLAGERKSLEEAFRLRAEYPDLVAGYDLVGFETTGHKTIFYLENLLNAAIEFSKKYQTDLPYFFHDGESNWANNVNLFDAVLLKTKRIGHGFNLFHFPFLMKQVKQQDICLEVCPISNQVLGYVSDLRMHPAVSYLRRGFPCILSSDDPMIFKTVGLSYDFWEAIMAWNLHLADIKKLCINSILYSALDVQEKNQALASWQKAWDLFVNDVIIELKNKSE